MMNSSSRVMCAVPARRRGAPRFLLLGLAWSALLIGVPGAGSRGAETTDPAAANKAPAPNTPDDGFTRESMAELGRPQPTPPPRHGSVAATTRKSTQLDPKDFASVHHRSTHRRTAPARAQVTVVKRQPRRNPVVSFVYWWNGFVLRTFHTKNGTVMLKTIGAKA